MGKMVKLRCYSLFGLCVGLSLCSSLSELVHYLLVFVCCNQTIADNSRTSNLLEGLLCLFLYILLAIDRLRDNAINMVRHFNSLSGLSDQSLKHVYTLVFLPLLYREVVNISYTWKIFNHWISVSELVATNTKFKVKK